MYITGCHDDGDDDGVELLRSRTYKPLGATLQQHVPNRAWHRVCPTTAPSAVKKAQ